MKRMPGTSIIHSPRGAALRNLDVLYIAMNNISHVAQPSGCCTAQNCPSSPEAKCHIPSLIYGLVFQTLFVSLSSPYAWSSVVAHQRVGKLPFRKRQRESSGGGGARWRLYRIMLKRCRAQPVRSQPHSKTDHISPHDSHEGQPLNRWERDAECY